jgi:predicted TIM-barrel fold metal-dependent hydrolase
MRVIDMFIHPVVQANEGNLHDLSRLDWNAWCAKTLSSMDSHQVTASGVCVMDAGILDRPEHLSQLRTATASGRFWFTLMPDLRRGDAADQVAAAAASGFRGITFHSYLQAITPADYPAVVHLAVEAEALGLFVGLCTAYGSKHMFDYHSLPLAAAVASETAGPVVLYHNGGARVLDAMLLCEMWPHLLLETSFSLSYWVGSSVETDLAFAIRKIGAQRVLFGSDAPFLPLDTALRDHADFFARHGFTRAEQLLILGDAAHALFPFLAPS